MKLIILSDTHIKNNVTFFIYLECMAKNQPQGGTELVYFLVFFNIVWVISLFWIYRQTWNRIALINGLD